MLELIFWVMEEVDSIIQRFGNQPIFSLTLNDFLKVTKAVIEGGKPTEATKYFTRRDIMESFGVSYPTIVDHEKRGLLTSNKKIGHKHLYSQQDIDDYLTRLPKAPSCPVR